MPFVVTGFSIYPIILGCLFVPSDRPHTRDRRGDWLGAIAITAAQILLTLGLTFSIANNRGWKAPCMCYLGDALSPVLAVLLFSLFVWRQEYELDGT